MLIAVKRPEPPFRTGSNATTMRRLDLPCDGAERCGRDTDGKGRRCVNKTFGVPQRPPRDAGPGPPFLFWAWLRSHVTAQLSIGLMSMFTLLDHAVDFILYQRRSCD